MRKIIIAGNWKMNNTIEEARRLVAGLLEHKVLGKVEIVVAPPFTAIHAVAAAVTGSDIQVAAQNLYWEESGAFTGEVSPQMILEAGAAWVIIGHSERRQLFGETGETVNKRINAALKEGLKPIVCVGETLEEREAGKTFDVLNTQLEEGLAGLGAKDMDAVSLAYEPVWAIGTGKTATSGQADEAHRKIREKIAAMFDNDTAAGIRILYGGSVKPSNALELLSCENVDGALVGGASLKAEDFTAIIKAGEEAS